jgi:hypothetical protein
LPYCLKALEIHKKHLGQNWVDVIYARTILGVIYTGLEEQEKPVLEQNDLPKIWKLISNKINCRDREKGLLFVVASGRGTVGGSVRRRREQWHWWSWMGIMKIVDELKIMRKNMVFSSLSCLAFQGDVSFSRWRTQKTWFVQNPYSLGI